MPVRAVSRRLRNVKRHFGIAAPRVVVRTQFPRRWLWVAAVLLGSVVSLQSVWNFADLANALMAVPNLISLIALSPVLVAETKRHLWELKK